ncbi:NADP-dependent oxidoreductase [Actinomadura scrupuli]|uniref:NADP-dependent oxidoreductase n=1 Tax=Actinomadura scrupuli TaxID=559629 RepID=UPI003D954D35
MSENKHEPGGEPHATMRAILYDTTGGPEVLYLAETPRPTPIPTEVLVRVHTAGVNPVDAKTRAGNAPGPMVGPPFMAGWDLSGIVEKVGFGVTRFRPGDEVYGMPRFPRPAGTYAEYVAAPSRQLAGKPATLSHQEAGALPLAGLTAWQILVDTAKAGPGQRVLVHAAAGGVGHLAVQIAKLRGAHVIGTARAAQHDFLHDLGADEVIDYTTARFEEVTGDLDVVVDLVGGETSTRSLRVLRTGGLLVPVPRGDATLVEEAAVRGIRVERFMVEPDYHGLERLAELVDAGRLRIVVNTVLPLDQAAEAHRRIESGHSPGKMVLTLRE